MPYHYDSRNYDPSAEFEPELIPPGDYICKVEAARWDTTRSGFEMIVLQLAVKGFRSRLWYNVVCKCDTPEEQKKTDQWVGSVFAAFGLSPSADVQVSPLVGKVGAVHVKNENRDGEMRARAAYLLKRDKAVALSNSATDAKAAGTQPTSYRSAQTRGAARTAPGFDRYGEAYPPAQNVSMDENDNFVPAEAEEADIPF